MGLEWTRQQGSEGDLGLLKGVIAQIDAWRGDYEAADAGADEAVELARLGGSPMTLADALRVRASIDGYRGRFDRARETLGPAWAELGRPDEGRFTQATESILGHIAHATGDAEAADRHFTAATAALEAAGIREMVGYRFLGDHVEAVLALGDIDRAEAIVGTMDRQAAAFPRPWTLAVRPRARALVLAARGDLDAAIDAFDEAESHHERLDAPYELGRTLLARASVHRRRTEKRLAKEALERALGPVRGQRRRAVGRTRPGGAEPHPLPDDADGADRDRAADGRPRRDRPDEPRDRGDDVRQPQDRRGPARERLRQAGDPVAGGARRADGGAERRPRRGRERGPRREFVGNRPFSQGSPTP